MKTYLWFNSVFLAGTIVGARASSLDEALEMIKNRYGMEFYDTCKEDTPIVLNSPLGTMEYVKVKKKAWEEGEK